MPFPSPLFPHPPCSDRREDGLPRASCQFRWRHDWRPEQDGRVSCNGSLLLRLSLFVHALQCGFFAQRRFVHGKRFPLCVMKCVMAGVCNEKTYINQ